MSQKQFSPRHYWNKLAESHRPALSCTAAAPAEFAAWKEKALPKLEALLGAQPQRVPLAPDVEYVLEDGDIIRERVVIDTEANMSVPCHVLYPKAMPADKSAAAVVCVSGHNPFGCGLIAGIAGEPAQRDYIAMENGDYGLQMAKAGFFVIVPELRGFGERKDGPDPFPGRDSCDVYNNIAALFGQTMLGLNIWDVRRVIDYLETRPEVDPGRIGMMGLSYGGTMTTFTAAVEPRIKAADIMGYVNPIAAFAVRNANFCGVQYLPGLYTWFDTWDIAGLIAPRPLLVEMGLYDQCFPIKDTIRGFEGISRIYQAAGAQAALYRDIYPAGHSFGGNLAFDFFKKHL